MKYAIPIVGLVLVGLAAYVSVAECRRVLLAAQGDLKSLRPFGRAALAAFAVIILTALITKQPLMYLALAALAVVAWITIPAAIYISYRIRMDGPMNIGRKR
jgi:hypothetical protein